MFLHDVKEAGISFVKSLLRFPLLHFFRWVIRHFTFKTSDSMACLVGKTAIVTGGNSGIGYATSLLLASRGCRVIIACRRDAQKERDAIIDTTGNPNIIIKKLDLSKIKSIRKFAEEIKDTEHKIDILINNAGVGSVPEKVTEDGMNAVMQINCFGHILLTYLLIDQLKMATSARVVFVSSILALFDQMTLDNFNPIEYELEADIVAIIYSNSKLGNILAAQELGKRLFKYGISVNCADPGIVPTPIFPATYSVEIRNKSSLKSSLDILNFFFGTNDIMGAQCSFHLATSRDVKNGLNYFRCREFPKPRSLKDEELCNKIWNTIEVMLGLNFEPI